MTPEYYLTKVLHGEEQPAGPEIPANGAVSWVRLPFENGEPAGAVVDFATGWLKENGSSTGRPVGVTVGGDGALYVSDDKGGFIYRISYHSQ